MIYSKFETSDIAVTTSVTGRCTLHVTPIPYIDHTSTFDPYVFFAKSSGAAYAGLPHWVEREHAMSP